MLLALCHHSLGPRVMQQLPGGKALTKGPTAAQAPEVHVGVGQDGDSVCSEPQGPSTSRWPKDAPAQEPIAGQRG